MMGALGIRHARACFLSTERCANQILWQSLDTKLIVTLPFTFTFSGLHVSLLLRFLVLFFLATNLFTGLVGGTDDLGVSFGGRSFVARLLADLASAGSCRLERGGFGDCLVMVICALNRVSGAWYHLPMC